MLPPTPLATNTAAAAEQHRHHTDGNTTAACQRIPGPHGTGAQAMPRSAGSAREYNGGPATLPCRGEATTRTRRDDLPPAADLPSLGACEGRKTQKGKGGGSNVSCGTTVYPQRQANPHGRTAPAGGILISFSFIVMLFLYFCFWLARGSQCTGAHRAQANGVYGPRGGPRRDSTHGHGTAYQSP